MPDQAAALDLRTMPLTGGTFPLLERLFGPKGAGGRLRGGRAPRYPPLAGPPDRRQDPHRPGWCTVSPAARAASIIRLS
jgi:hypothetical protein